MNGTATTVKKKLSGAAIVSMIFGMAFAIAAACMAFLPVFSDVNGTTMDMSLLNEQARGMLEQCTKAFENLSRYTNEAQFQITVLFVQIITATVVFFGNIVVAVMVLLGKALNFKKGGRVLALIFSVLGVLMSGFYLVWTIVYCGQYKSQIGIGPILMASFSFLSFIFCCIAVGNKAALKTVGGAPAYDPNSYYAPQNNAPVNPYTNPAPQPVQPQNMGYVDAHQAFAPQPPVTQPPVTQPPFSQPPMVQPPVPQVVEQPSNMHIQRQPEEHSTIAQNGAIEGVSGDYAGAVINLKPGEKIVIGRDAASCNIILSAERKDISRKHCSVKYDSYTDSFKVIDMSSNGTYVNGQQMVKDQETSLPVGTVISLGNGENQFRLKKV
ncbi:MAG TPA: hypothetical protein DEO95_09040 [Ruminococcaceae bacterium]|nr:hypothetical protein [Oscillospiraceae bacterium]